MTNEDIIEEFDKEFVKDLGPNIEPVFLDPTGSVGPIKLFLLEALQAKDKSHQEEKLAIVESLGKEFGGLNDGCGCCMEVSGEVYFQEWKAKQLKLI